MSHSLAHVSMETTSTTYQKQLMHPCVCELGWDVSFGNWIGCSRAEISSCVNQGQKMIHFPHRNDHPRKHIFALIDTYIPSLVKSRKKSQSTKLPIPLPQCNGITKHTRPATTTKLRNSTIGHLIRQTPFRIFRILCIPSFL
jgi:hypothetical protein